MKSFKPSAARQYLREPDPFSLQKWEFVAVSFESVGISKPYQKSRPRGAAKCYLYDCLILFKLAGRNAFSYPPLLRKDCAAMSLHHSFRLSCFFLIALVSFILLGVTARPALAQGLTTVPWSADNLADGLGFGFVNLAGTTVEVNYSTATVLNAGTTITTNWNTSLATNGAVGTGVSSMRAGILGAVVINQGSGASIDFSRPLNNPTLLLNFADSGTGFDFTGLNFSVLDSNNAQITGNVVTFLGASNTADDGIALRFNGVYSRLDFVYRNTTGTFQTAAFTIGVAAPEPGSLALLVPGLVPLAVIFLRRSCRYQSTV